MFSVVFVYGWMCMGGVCVGGGGGRLDSPKKSVFTFFSAISIRLCSIVTVYIT